MFVKEALELDLKKPSGLTAGQINYFLKNCPLAGLGQSFIDNEKNNQVNARYFCAHAIHESGWGRSRIAQDKNNLFGFGAYDRDPYNNAYSYSSKAACIDSVGRYIAKHYLTPGGQYYNGPTLPGMNVRYATDKLWAEKIARLMCQMPDPIMKERESIDMFKDVPKDEWYAKYVEKAAKYGILNGVAPGKFEPNRGLTRAEFAAAAVRLYEATNEDFVEIINQVLPAVVQVENYEHGSQGSGTIIHQDGYVLTNAHVVTGTDDQGNVIVPNWVGFRSPDRIFHGADYAEGIILAYDTDKDLAICHIKTQGPFPVLPIYRQELPVESTRVIVVGSPLGLIRSVSEGIVSGYRILNGLKLIQTEAEINPGNSGGAMVNLQGELLGVPSLKMMAAGIEGLGFAIIPDEIRAFIKSYVDAGKLPVILKGA